MTGWMSCSVYGMVFDHEVAVIRPIEQVIMRGLDGTFPILGASSFWNALQESVEDIRAIVRRIGETLRDEAEYRGSFGVDGILSADGERPHGWPPKGGSTGSTVRIWSMYS
ncbi:hypothetical protein OV450_7974 [Actinobacteria bacterium OV450]|nr:hypothetical protein OV450_7974 [Actinobacteria bacterium OV450]